MYLLTLLYCYHLCLIYFSIENYDMNSIRYMLCFSFKANSMKNIVLNIIPKQRLQDDLINYSSINGILDKYYNLLIKQGIKEGTDR